MNSNLIDSESKIEEIAVEKPEEELLEIEPIEEIDENLVPINNDLIQEDES